ncbi:MAG TPA: hypothetical protein PKD73_10175 [Burkholderiaceae bacterium]|nr:hypothetical protein [Burkholderiaceae bacterium]
MAPDDPRSARTLPWPVRLLRQLLVWLFGLVLVFEEWGWQPLQRAMAWVGAWPGFRWIEKHIAALPPRAALVAFAAPTLLLLPVKIGALQLVASGHVMLGALVVVVAKIVGTALVARIYQLTEPALMRLPWFARLHARWMAWKTQVLALVRASWPWRWARVMRRRMARRFGWFARRP